MTWSRVFIQTQICHVSDWMISRKSSYQIFELFLHCRRNILKRKMLSYWLYCIKISDFLCMLVHILRHCKLIPYRKLRFTFLWRVRNIRENTLRVRASILVKKCEMELEFARYWNNYGNSCEQLLSSAEALMSQYYDKIGDHESTVR